MWFIFLCKYWACIFSLTFFHSWSIEFVLLKCPLDLKLYTRLENLAWSHSVFIQFSLCRKHIFMKPWLFLMISCYPFLVLLALLGWYFVILYGKDMKIPQRTVEYQKVSKSTRKNQKAPECTEKYQKVLKLPDNTRKGLFKHVQACSSMFKPVQACSSLFKYVQAFQSMFNPVQACSILFK